MQHPYSYQHICFSHIPHVKGRGAWIQGSKCVWNIFFWIVWGKCVLIVTEAWKSAGLTGMSSDAQHAGSDRVNLWVSITKCDQFNLRFFLHWWPEKAACCGAWSSILLWSRRNSVAFWLHYSAQKRQVIREKKLLWPCPKRLMCNLITALCANQASIASFRWGPVVCVWLGLLWMHWHWQGLWLWSTWAPAAGFLSYQPCGAGLMWR